MTVKNTIQTAILVSGLALASSFSVLPSTTYHSAAAAGNTDILSRSSPQPPLHVASNSNNRRRRILCSTTSSNQEQQQEIYLLDEVDSIFDCVDKNGDGEITLEELKAHLVDEMGYTKKYTEYLFESIDTDSNGSISREELRFAFYNFEALSMYMTFGMGGADMTQRKSFKKLALQSAQQYYDVGEDGSGENSSKLLLDDLADLIFGMIDTDQSGEITRKELKAHFDLVTEKLSNNSKDKATTKQAEEYVQTMFETLDIDENGTICREEIRAAFEKYDFKLLARTFGLKVYQSTN
jgi:Ca2+-binding EF-hand superfamily protein